MYLYLGYPFFYNRCGDTLGWPYLLFKIVPWLWWCEFKWWKGHKIPFFPCIFEWVGAT